MSDFEEKLNTILSSPEAMSQIAAIAQSLGGDSKHDTPAAEEAPQETQPQDVPPQTASSQGEAVPALASASSLTGLLSGIDPGMIAKLLPLVSELNSSQNDERAQLLYALRPFLKESRRDKIEEALRLAKLLHVGKTLLSTLGGSHHV